MSVFSTTTQLLETDLPDTKPRDTEAIRTETGRRDVEREVWGVPLDITGVTKWFGPKQVLRGIDLSVRAGEFIVIVGHSGSGKSTLLRVVAGLERATDGEVTLDGQRLIGLNPATRVMFQDARLLPWRRVLDNVALGLTPLHRGRAAEALAHVGLADRARDWPSILSGGQRQRVALARALASRPRLLLLDEPLGALDALTRLEMQDLIETLWQEQRCTTLLVTHDPEEAVALADRVVVIEAGNIQLDLEIGLPRPRQRNTGAFQALRQEILDSVMSRSTSF